MRGGWCRLCVREFVETLDAGASCPKCSAAFTVDLTSDANTAGNSSSGGSKAYRSNKAGTVCVAGKIKASLPQLGMARVPYPSPTF